MLHRSTRVPAAFTIIELLVVLAILATAGGLVVPAIQQGKAGEESSGTMNNLSQCAKAVHAAHDQFNKFPPYYGIYGAKTTPLSFHTHLLPNVEQAALYNQKELDPKEIVPAFLSRLDPTVTGRGAGAANFPVNLRLFYTQGGLGTLSPQTALIYPKMPGSFQDGVSQTLLYATKYMHCGTNGGSMWADKNALNSPTAATFGVSMALWQKAPKKDDCVPVAGTAVSFSTDFIHVALCDASVRTVSSKVSVTTWQAVHTPSAGDVPGKDWQQ